MSKLNEYMGIKKKVESAQQKADQATGALSTVMKQLKDTFGCTTLKLAKVKLAKLQKQEKNLKAEEEDAIEAFEEQWEGE